MRAWALLGLAIGCAACDDCKKGSSAPEVASPGDVAAAKTKVETIDAARRAALASAKETITGRNDLGVCPVELGTFGVGNAKDITGAKKAWGGYDVPRWKADRGDDFLANFPDELCAIERLGIAYADEVGTKPGPRGFQLASVLRDTSPSKWQVDDLVKTDDAFDFELVIDDEIPPKIVSDSTFAPGVIRARFYVWDNAKSAIGLPAVALTRG